MIRDCRAGKTFQISWPEWIIFCNEQGIDPIENCELGFDLGGGDSYEIVCYDQPDEIKHLGERQEKEDEFNHRRWKEVGNEKSE